MSIRPASIDDALEIAAVHIASWRAIYRGHMPSAVLDALDLEQRATQWRKRLALPGVDLLVAEAPLIVGFCNLAPSRDADAGPATGEITAIYLHPDHWRRGLGRELIGATLSRARLRGYGAVTLWVLDKNSRARSFYEALGFSTDGQERSDTRLIGFPLHEVRYAKPMEHAAQQDAGS